MTNMKEGKPSMASAVRYRLLFIALVVVIFIARADKIRPYYGGKATLRVSLDHFLSRTPKGVSVTKEVLDYEVETLIEGLVSREIMRKVIRDNDLINNEDFAGPRAHDASLDRLSRELALSTRIRKHSRGAFFDVFVRHRNAKLASQLCNWVAEGMVESTRSEMLQQANISFSLLSEARDRALQKLRESEEALLEYRMNHNLTIPPDEQEGLWVDQLRAAQRRLADLEDIAIKLERDLQLVDSLDGELTRETLSLVPTLSNDPGVQEANEQLLSLESHLEDAKLRRGNEHPEVEQLEKNLRERIANFDLLLKKSVSQHEGKLGRVRSSVRAAEEKINNLKGKLLQLAQARTEDDLLQKEIQFAMSTYESVNKRIEENRNLPVQGEPPLSLFERSIAPSNIAPSQRRAYLWAGAKGLALAVFAILIFDAWTLFFGRPRFAR